MDCIFCKIVEGEVPAEKVYENDDIVAFLDVNPRSLGHTMVIPKIHVSNLLELPDDKVEPFFKGVKMVSEMIEKALSPSGYTMGLNHGKVSGQVVDHLHFHIIPRFEGDNGGSIQDVINNPSEEKLSDIAEKIRQKTLKH
jgi:histidine triad (HIT) family protein